VPENFLERLIREQGNDDHAIFVFPSDIAASLWLAEALDITGRETLPARRFIAWDRFKEEAVQATVSGKSPVSSVLRRLYALELAERNRAAQVPLLSSIIPTEHAAEGSVFARWIAGILPQLAVWEHKRKVSRTGDAEDADLAFLLSDYSKFLDDNKLFEPSWQRPPLRETGDRYYIIFHETIEDFDEYAPLLLGSPSVIPIPVQQRPVSEPLTLDLYENSREEIRACALEIETLLRAGTKPEEIAISLPDAETASPYLLRELGLRGIPFEYRMGTNLGELPAGRLFSLVAKCASSEFSFASMKSILLDRVIPWKHRDIAERLIEFGVRNHCVASWEEAGKKIDVWEEAFNDPTHGDPGDATLREFYRDLKEFFRGMTDAKTFTACRNNYFAFRNDCLDMNLLNKTDDAILARCVEELNALAALEGRYAKWIPSNPFAFFVSIVDEKKYVPQRAPGGVSVFPYRVAAGTPFAHHFILDASQDKATVLYRQLPFLRQDKRLHLNLQETDASAPFFLTYAGTPRVATKTAKATQEELPWDDEPRAGARFSCAVRSFSGYRVPHGYFAKTNSNRAGDDDPYQTERKWHESFASAAFPDRLHGAQRQGFTEWRKRPSDRFFSYLETPYGERLPGLAARIAEKQMQDGDVRVSQSDLASFSICNARWFLSRILAIEPETSDAELLNERNLGLLYHDVLKKLYERIRDTDRAFASKRIDEYKSWARELAELAAADHADFRGPIAAPLIATLIARIADGVERILDLDAATLDGFVPEFLEDDIAFSRDGIRYYGKIDRISRRIADGATVLIDYKSGKPPAISEYSKETGEANKDFQIPMYIFLAEESPESPYRQSKIECAWFASIGDGEWRPIVNDKEIADHGRKKSLTRDSFAPAMASFLEETKVFVEAVKAGDFTRPIELPRDECVSCDFRKICRYVYTVRP
jgi:hypothetical protein